jgi:putative tricarboxylic transport membrane protein
LLKLWIRGAVLVGLAGTAAQAAGPLMIVAPAAPGGGWDQTARALQQAFSAVDPGLSVQVDNVPGAAGTIGLARFVSGERGNPDALLITGLVMLSGITTNHAPVTLDQTTPIARLTGEPEVIVVPAASPLRTLADLVAAFTASPSTVTWGGGSAGGTDDLLVRLLAEAIGVPPARANYIAFAGGGPALAALLGGQLTAGVSGYSEFAGQIEAGALRALAISSPSTSGLTIAPTLREQGIDLEFANWRGIVAAPGLTDSERDLLTSRLEKVIRSDAWQALLRRNGWDDMFLSGAPFRQFLIAEQQRVNAVLRRLSTSSEAGATDASSGHWLTPMTLPIAVVAGALVLALVVFWRGEIAPEALTGERRALVLLATLGAHALAFPFIGFIVASTALFVIAARLFGSASWPRTLLIGLTTAIVLFVMFTSGLGLNLPLDPLTRWLFRS